MLDCLDVSGVGNDLRKLTEGLELIRHGVRMNPKYDRIPKKGTPLKNLKQGITIIIPGLCVSFENT